MFVANGVAQLGGWLDWVAITLSLIWSSVPSPFEYSVLSQA